MTAPLKVLIACESSGTVRDAFTALGHDATSCDMMEAETAGGKHYTGDVRDILDGDWDLIVAHPPCTYLNVAAAWAFEDPNFEKYPEVGYHQKVKAGTLTGEARRAAQTEALDFVRLFMDSKCPRVAIENPVGAISSKIRKADQYVQPYEYGDDASKKTGLWLKGLPLLQPTQPVPPARWACCGKWQPEGTCSKCGSPTKPRWSNQTPRGQDKSSPGADRWQHRSKTYQGIADAMALQWGGDTGWRKVSFAADCYCPLCDKYGLCGCDDSLCSICENYYSECPCFGPTQDGIEYEDRGDTLWGRPEITEDDCF